LTLAVFSDESIWHELRDYFLARSEAPQPLPSVDRLSCLRSEHTSEFHANRDALQMTYTSLLDAKASTRNELRVVRSPGPQIVDPLLRSATIMASFIIFFLNMFRCTPCTFTYRITTLGSCGTGWLSPCRLVISPGEPAHDQLKEGLTNLDAFILEQQVQCSSLLFIGF
jgi:hypothetical protein